MDLDSAPKITRPILFDAEFKHKICYSLSWAGLLPLKDVCNAGDRGIVKGRADGLTFTGA